MTKLCSRCGAQNPDQAAVCLNCGAPLMLATPQSYPPPQNYPPAQGYPHQGYPTQAGYAQQQGYPPQPPRKSNTLKWVLGILGVLALCGAMVIVGIVYVVHKAKQKVESAIAESGGVTSAAPILGDTCRFLSKEDVSAAIDMVVVATKSNANGCEYLVAGTAQEMTAKHFNEITKNSGATPDQQKMIEGMAKGIFNAQPKSSDEGSDAEAGKTPVLVFRIDGNSARVQMKMDKKLLGFAPGAQELSGVGDEAFIASNAMLLVRKGDRMIHFTLTSCPCSAQAIVPLAKKLADQL